MGDREVEAEDARVGAVAVAGDQVVECHIRWEACRGLVVAAAEWPAPVVVGGCRDQAAVAEVE